MSNLVIVGSIGLDDVKTPFGSVENVLGGSCSYASLSAKFFCNSKIIGVVGEDFLDKYLDLFERNKICMEGLKKEKGKTFHWKAEYNDLNKANTLETSLNVFADFKPIIPDSYLEEKYIFLGNIDPELQLNVLNQLKDIKLSAMDTMNFWIDNAKKYLLKVLKKIDILFINDEEIKQLTEEPNVLKACKQVLKMGPEYIVVKRGEYGAFLYGKDCLFYTPAFPIEDVVDPTGAGDSFAGGFLGYLASKELHDVNDYKMAMLYGTVISSINIQGFSSKKIIAANREEIDKRLEQLKKYIKL